MARKRFMARRSFGGFRRFARRHGSKGSGMMPLVGAAVYGAGRSKLSTLIAPVTNMIPLGGISDEVGLIIGLHFVKKMVKNPTIRQIATAGQMIEAAQIGQAIALGQVSLQNSGTTSSGGW